jgi:hypothetical protein
MVQKKIFERSLCSLGELAGGVIVLPSESAACSALLYVCNRYTSRVDLGQEMGTTPFPQKKLQYISAPRHSSD